MEILKALSHENRLRILNLLKVSELCVCELEHIIGVNQSNASRHLIKLKQADLIKAEQKAQWVYYSLNPKIVEVHPFIQKIIDDELKELALCQEDNKKLANYQESGFTCADLRRGLKTE